MVTSEWFLGYLWDRGGGAGFQRSTWIGFFSGKEFDQLAKAGDLASIFSSFLEHLKQSVIFKSGFS